MRIERAAVDRDVVDVGWGLARLAFLLVLASLVVGSLVAAALAIWLLE